MAKKDKSRQGDLFYPWATLYSIESNIHSSGSRRGTKRVGRPSNPMTRRQTSTSITDDESRIWDEVVYTLKRKMHPAKVQKNQVLGFALRLLARRIEEVKDEPFRTWEEIAALVFDELDEE